MFVGKNTWEEWGLIASSRPVVAPPASNKKAIEIPGRNGTFDMSTVLTGYMTYKNRTGSWEFIVDNKNVMVYPKQQNRVPYEWQTIYSRLMSYLHGKRMKCVLEDDKEWYYEGLFDVGGWRPGDMYSTVTISYDLYPYKRSIQMMSEPWLWDPFNFETGIVTIGPLEIESGGYREIGLPPFEEPYIVPKVYTSLNNASIDYDDVTVYLTTAGQDFEGKTYPDLKFKKNVSPQTCLIRNALENDPVIVKISYRRSEF